LLSYTNAEGIKKNDTFRASFIGGMVHFIPLYVEIGGYVLYDYREMCEWYGSYYKEGVYKFGKDAGSVFLRMKT
jgi:hypothetical protein